MRQIESMKLVSNPFNQSPHSKLEFGASSDKKYLLTSEVSTSRYKQSKSLAPSPHSSMSQETENPYPQRQQTVPATSRSSCIVLNPNNHTMTNSELREYRLIQAKPSPSDNSDHLRELGESGSIKDKQESEGGEFQ